ncbi:hypothetical protein K493DRAFT_314981 [Basidiobolus meristosporus CBS 931.73]|uniref:Uncharacterized protein n=1 Tax=Basidiobolus meristosporus CBS 931.73 TaxID=1314790 RepID=A0A1Y1YBV2_9FUNG|nr:hypothetical protein K493DRAFT_314981 [Basidiobolus meristosporus CBS 931.73]|eukprot:ORX95458.1 hypothetical protein K493DRAFT_314981 [Basidiobolus meristosporus CBS 931.73]
MLVNKDTSGNSTTLKLHSLLSEFRLLTNKKSKAPAVKSTPLTIENLKTHNTLLPPSKEFRHARISKYVQNQAQELQKHNDDAAFFAPPSLSPLEDKPCFDSIFCDMDDSVSVIHLPRAKSKVFGTRVNALMHKFFPSFYSTYPSGQVYW